MALLGYPRGHTIETETGCMEHCSLPKTFLEILALEPERFENLTIQPQRSGAALYFLGDLLAGQAFEDPQFHHPPECGINGGEPVQNIVDFD